MSCVEIDDLVERYVASVEASLRRKLTWEQDDLALQNIQARVRGPTVWLLANVKNALLLSTSNRSEAAVGYATMDGDTCGGLSPIAGIDKAFLWIGSDGWKPPGRRGCTRLPSWPSSRRRRRPRNSARSPVPDRQGGPDALSGARRDRACGNPRQAIAARGVPARAATVSAVRPAAIGVVDRAVLSPLVPQPVEARALAPSFHLDDENLDPKTWCRFPILSGGFQRELGELRRRSGNSAAKHNLRVIRGLRSESCDSRNRWASADDG